MPRKIPLISAIAWSSLKVKTLQWHTMVAEEGFSTHESGRVGLRRAIAGDNPVVQTGEEVCSGNLTRGAATHLP